MRTRIALFATLLAATTAHATVPSQFSVQGVLRDGAGKLQTTQVSVKVSLYDAQTAGNKLAGPYEHMVMASNGLFTVSITDAALQTSLAPASEVWLEVTAGADLFPRQPASPQLFALMCGTADVAKSLPGVTIEGSGAQAQVGIGVMTPSAKLHVYENSADPALFIQQAGTGPKLRVGLDGNLEVTNNGNIGVGTIDPGNARLNVKGINDTNSNYALYVQNSTAAPMFNVRNDGRVGIGTTTPSAALDVQTVSGGVGLKVSTNAGAFGYGATVTVVNDQTKALVIANSTSATEPFIVYGDGKVGVGVAVPSEKLDVAGNIKASGTITPSDARLKTNVRTIDHALDEIVKLRGVRFDWKKDGKRSVGFIAQEVEQVFPEFVSTGSDGMKGVDYAKFASVLVQATKELRAENQALRARLDQIEARLARRAAR
jgi:hypothetical protein